MKTFLFLVLLLQAQAFNTVVPEKSYADPPTGDFVTNGIITPLDQEMRNFYIRNADGAIEVQLTPDAKIGLQSRVKRGGFEARIVEFQLGSKKFSHELPKDLYVKRTFKDAEAVQKYLKSFLQTNF